MGPTPDWFGPTPYPRTAADPAPHKDLPTVGPTPDWFGDNTPTPPPPDRHGFRDTGDGGGGGGHFSRLMEAANEYDDEPADDAVPMPVAPSSPQTTPSPGAPPPLPVVPPTPLESPGAPPPGWNKPAAPPVPPGGLLGTSGGGPVLAPPSAAVPVPLRSTGPGTGLLPEAGSRLPPPCALPNLLPCGAMPRPPFMMPPYPMPMFSPDVGSGRVLVLADVLGLGYQGGAPGTGAAGTASKATRRRRGSKESKDPDRSDEPGGWLPTATFVDLGCLVKDAPLPPAPQAEVQT